MTMNFLEITQSFTSITCYRGPVCIRAYSWGEFVVESHFVSDDKNVILRVGTETEGIGGPPQLSTARYQVSPGQWCLESLRDRFGGFDLAVGKMLEDCFWGWRLQTILWELEQAGRELLLHDGVWKANTVCETNENGEIVTVARRDFGFS